jgi:type II secretory pathway component PulK
MRPKIPAKQHGVALITALLVTALATIMAVSLRWRR